MLAITVAAMGYGGQAAAQQAGVVDEIVVTGQRASDRDSLLKKRDAVSAVEVVSANDVGKLPDQNVAEAVRRLSGVSVATDKGEGRYLIIRGLEPSLANVTINNQTASAPEPESRQVKLDDIPSALIGSVTVIKALTPDLDANAIAGQVDINTLTAFDKNKTIFSMRAVGGVYDDTNAQAKEGDISAGGLFGVDRQFGLLVAANYSKRPTYSEDIIGTSDTAWQTINGFDVPSGLDSRVYDPAFRTRKGAVANFDWRPSEDVKVYARFMYSQYDDNETRNRFRFIFPSSASGYSGMTADGGTITGTRGERYVRRRRETTDTTTFSVGGDFAVGPGVLTVQGTHSLATKEDPIRDEFRYRTGSTALTGVYKLNDELFDLTPSASSLDPTRYNLNTYKANFRSAEEDLNQIRADYKMPMDSWGDGSYLKFGAKYLSRDKSTDQTGRSYVYNGPTHTLAGETGRSVASTYDGRYAFGPVVDFEAARFFFNSNRGLFGLDNAGSIADTLGSDFEINETITSAYVMGSVTRDALTVIPGVRVERTEGDYKAIAVTATSTLNDKFNSFGSQSYTDWFPSLNMKYEFSPNLMMRASITTAIGRPNYDQLAPTVSVDTTTNTVTQGNPNLQPLESVNFDASLEYYFPSEGGISVGLFHKKLKNPIFTSTRVASGTFAGVPMINATITEPRNADEASVTGLEFNVQKPLTFLPEPFDGLGVNFNMTFVSGDTQVPGRSDDVPLFLQSKRVASAQIYYEKFGFSGRVAYTYHSKYLELVGTTENDDIYWGKQGSLSARAAYNVTKQFQVFVEGNNLNDELDYRYARTRSRMVEAERYGRSYRFGLSYTY
ncbi:MAG: TonB-dependent receptor [Pseudomonadota bacterium]|uniref:TonB-dependent receptor n=1 Tax=unclassified Phenylobacterium TaxID=2640670 RepID=UPI00138EF782|nr:MULTISPECIES: TonB-dependent receptor [unclassified Phenylobacterium]MBT9471058.1 TonB-dependent receptor [Phenylobacterium sp.]